MTKIERNCSYCEYYDLPVISCVHNPCEDCFSHFGFPNFELKEDIKMAIESMRDCDTCKFVELNKIQYPCCDCYGDNDYKHFKERDGEPKETVNHPNHYQSSKFEVIDIIDEFGKDYGGESAFDFGNVVKYLLRAKKKNGLEDLNNARWYLDRLIDRWED